MRYAFQFALLAAAAIWLCIGVFQHSLARGAALWTGLSFAVVGTAYAFRRPTLLFKRSEGRRPIWAWILLTPYFGLASLSLFAYRIVRRTRDDRGEIANGLTFSRRPSRRALTDNLAVLDLAAEFARVPSSVRAYKSLPLLDGLPVPTEALNEGVKWIDSQLERGPVMVHCALGHGRTGSIVIAWMLTHAQADDVDDAIAKLRRLRPAFGISPAQREQLMRVYTTPHPRG